MYTSKDFSHLLGLEGFSENALTTHFKLYEGYVKNTNLLVEKLKGMNSEEQPTPEYAELKRRFGWEWNGMRLHEYYFGALTKEQNILKEDSELEKALGKEFGSIEKWKQDFINAASARGIGWMILYYDKQEDRLMNVWVNEHNESHLAGATVLLNIDIFEHAFMIDYNTNKAEYITAFINAIDWSVVEQRYLEAR